MITRPGFLLAALFTIMPAGTHAQDGRVPASAGQATPPKDTSLVQAMPSGAVAFAETTGLAQLIADLQRSDAVKAIFESDQFREFQSTEQFQKVENGRQLAEFVLRMDLWEAGRKLLGGRAGVALYPKKDSKEP
ncbi:MAG: hypothetical protein GWO24_08770, partial [Akkermansiaceae bacterium]|nr:hypothetical protein [Akkermansiaceae bacterium]